MGQADVIREDAHFLGRAVGENVWQVNPLSYFFQSASSATHGLSWNAQSPILQFYQHPKQAHPMRDGGCLCLFGEQH